MKCSDIEIAVANFFNARLHIMVPNISWGLGLHECDMLILNKSHYAVEVEIKISKSDIKKDLKKKHTHDSNKIRRLFFAIPEKLFTDDVISLIPAHAGILVIKMREGYSYKNLLESKTKIYVPEKAQCYIGRNAKINKSAKPFSDKDVVTMGRLGMLRYWGLRNKANLFPPLRKSKTKFNSAEGEPLFTLSEAKEIALAMANWGQGFRDSLTPDKYFHKRFGIDLSK